jgi:uncharacterized Zn-binding protein involved in type VI secretion
MPQAARAIPDPTVHGPPLNPGPGSPDVIIGFMHAWRALPAGMAAAIESASNAMMSFLSMPMLTPASAAAQLAQIQVGLAQVGGAAAAQGNPSAAVAAGSQTATLTAANAGLTATWTAASAVPGGQPAATAAYTMGIQAAAGAAASAVFSSLSGMADMHICAIPAGVVPHGPGYVTKGSTTVFINKLPASRQFDQVFEACGGPDPIAIGCPTVIIGG